MADGRVGTRDVPGLVTSLPDRFWSKVNKTETCWLWTGALGRNGYGQFFWDGQARAAHRLAYEDLVGPIPKGLQLDHLCRVRHCVNPAHLEPVTARENMLRGESLQAHNAKKELCPKCGGPYSPEVSTGARRCTPCRNERRREKWLRDDQALAIMQHQIPAGVDKEQEK